MSLDEAAAVTVVVARTFEQLGVRYVVGGSFASSVHGVPRSTNDVDFLAELRLDVVDQLVASLGDGFYLDGDAVRDAIRRGATFNAIHLETMFKVDVFVAIGGALHEMEFSRRREHRLSPDDDTKVFFASAEDMIIQKLAWFRSGGSVSERQWRDVLGIIKVQGPSLDVLYLRQWSSYAAVSDLLERALAEDIEP